MQSLQTFTWPVRVYYEDTDSGGVVYHSQYLNFMERARTEYLRHLGFELDVLQNNFGIIFVVHSMQIAFKKPAKFNDCLQIASQITKIGFGSFECAQSITLGAQTLITAQVKVACINAISFKPSAIPAPIKQKLT